MTSAQFKAWRDRHGFTQDQAADQLGVSVGAVAKFERQDAEIAVIPRAVEHACNFLDQKRTAATMLRSKIKDKIQSKGPPGHITAEVLQEILLEIVDLAEMDGHPPRAATL